MLTRLLASVSLCLALSGCMGSEGGNDFVGMRPGTPPPQFFGWMHPDIQDAWDAGYLGQGARITVVDDFIGEQFHANLGFGRRLGTHGFWTASQAGMIAPGAEVIEFDYNTGATVPLASSQLNVMNLSYSIPGTLAQSIMTGPRSAIERSLVTYAREGQAVIVKSAGNNAIGLDAAAEGEFDLLNLALIGAESAIFVGALDRHGTPGNLANMASYSNRAGSDTTVQNQFLSVGVLGQLTELDGTSFSATIVSGYAAVLGSKFTDASPSQITRQLLDTARTDTIRNYNPALHGRGEASISRALAPASIH